MAANPRAEALRLGQESAPERQLAPAPKPGKRRASISKIDASRAEDASETPAGDRSDDSRHEAIARAAYFLAEARAFEPGHELDDWLAAEQQVGVRQR
jgi:Protein of unknown function (DUF2934)